MPLSPDINEIVDRLERSLMPRLADFGRTLIQSNDRIVAETFSHRHADVVHNLGLGCHPVGSDSLNPRTVALIVTVIAIKGLSIKGYVQWQSPSFHHEGETAIYDTFEETDLARFHEELQALLSVLAAAVERGTPPQNDGSVGAQAAGPGHNPPMQRTGAAGISSVVRKLLGCGSGR